MAADIAQFFLALKRTWGSIMILEGSIADDLSHMQSRKPAVSHIFMRALFQERKMIQEYGE